MVSATAPSAPAAPVGTADGQSVTVTWVAPSDGGSPITGYRVTMTPADGPGQEREVDAGQTSVVFTDLASGSYIATVVASNAIGDSDASAASEPVTVAPPTVEPEVVATAVTAVAAAHPYGRAGTVEVTVSPAATGEVAIQVGGRTLTAAVSGGRASVRLPATALRPGRHRLRVDYRGAAGRFRPSATTVAVRVTKASPTVRLKPVKRATKRGRKATFRVVVRAGSVVPGGRVTVRVAGRKKTVRLDEAGRGLVRIKVRPRTEPGRFRVVAKYQGTALVKAGQDRARIRVLR